MPKARVRITELLRKSLEDEGLDSDEFCRQFGKWKDSGEGGEYSFYYFGKDGENHKPVRHGKRVLRHVHLPPENGDELVRWELDAKRLRRKTSDTCLIYAFDPTHGYLLIFIAREPEGHVFSGMKTREAAKFMEELADIAEAFIFDGRILI